MHLCDDGKCPDRWARRRCHCLEQQQLQQRLCASKCTGRRRRHRAACARLRDKSPGAHFVNMAGKVHRSLVLRTIGCPASEGPHTLRRRILGDIVADPNSRCGGSAIRRTLKHAALRSKKFEHGQDGVVPSATAPVDHDSHPLFQACRTKISSTQHFHLRISCAMTKRSQNLC